MRRDLGFIALCNASVCSVTIAPEHNHPQRIAVIGRQMSAKIPAASMMACFQHASGLLNCLHTPVTFVSNSSNSRDTSTK